LFLKEHTDVRNKLEGALRKKMGIPIPNVGNGSAPATQAEKTTAHPATHPAAQAAAAGAVAGKPRPAAGTK